MTKSNTTQLLMQVIEVWVMILQAVPSSRFLLKNKPFACPAAREHVMQLFVRKGIAAHRIDLLPLAAANAGQIPPLLLCKATQCRELVTYCKITFADKGGFFCEQPVMAVS